MSSYIFLKHLLAERLPFTSSLQLVPFSFFPSFLFSFILVPFIASLTIPLIVLGIAHVGGQPLREKISWGPMGLTRAPHKRRPRNALDTAPFATWQAWAKSLPRSQRSTLSSQIDQAAKRRGFVLLSAGPAHRALLSPAHVVVAISHQLRLVTQEAGRMAGGSWLEFVAAGLRLVVCAPLAVLRGSLRWLVAAIMLGEVDEWRREADGALLAWAVTIVKGDTLRGMWFYTSEPQAMIYFAALRLNVARAVAMNGVRWVDAGPSRGAAGQRVASLKAAYGFGVVREWGLPGQPCNYDGAFVSALPADAVFAEAAEDAHRVGAMGRPARAGAKGQ
jgi:hypothetical protein